MEDKNIRKELYTLEVLQKMYYHESITEEDRKSFNERYGSIEEVEQKIADYKSQLEN